MSEYEYEYEFKKYATDLERLKSTLDKYGVAIIPSVLDDGECNNMLSGIWDYFEHISKNWENPILRDKEQSWKEIYQLYPNHSMLIQHWNIGHSQVCWDVRQNPKILKIFSHLWNCKEEDLLVSFDALSFNVPPEVTNRGWNRNNCWLHSDQSFTDSRFKCVQSWVTALDVNRDDATLSFLEGSHLIHEHFGEIFEVEDKTNWYKLCDIEKEFYAMNGCKYKKIMCPKGSIVFWDSRTIHSGVEANRSRTKMNFRAIIYLCYMPRNQATEKQLEKRKKAFRELRMTSHWPCNVKLFSKNPRTYGGVLPKITLIDPPILTQLGKCLVGY